MNALREWVVILLFIVTYIQVYDCRRTGGGGYRPRPSPGRITTPRSYGGGTTPRHYGGGTTPRPYGGGTTPRPYGGGNQGVSTRRYTTPRSASGGSTPSSAGWNLPPKPGSPGAHYEPSKVTIKNKYVYNYPGYVGVPQPSHYPGYYQPSTHYSYSSFDTGSTALGLFMGYSLAKLTTPTFGHQSFYDGYTPRYDHYTVHHYYHGKDSVPKEQTITANTIVGCVGDSTTACPGNTTTLCTSNGALMCVVSATSTVPCTDNRQVNCVKSVISCVNNTAPECKNSNQNSTAISIPCVSNAKIFGEVKYVNNTIIPSNSTTSPNNNSTNSTTSTNNFTNSTESIITTQYPITTTPTTTTTVKEEEKKEAQNFCVTVIALPAKREPTKGEIALEEATNFISDFFEKSWGL